MFLSGVAEANLVQVECVCLVDAVFAAHVSVGLPFVYVRELASELTTIIQ